MNKYSSFIFPLFLAVALLFIPQVCRADLIMGFLLGFPPLFVAIASLGVVTIESWIIKRRLKKAGRKCLLVSFVVNGITALIGVLYYLCGEAWFFHNKIIVDHFSRHWFFYISILFISTLLVEALILRLFFKKEKWSSLLQTSAIMNILSYLFIPLFFLADAVFIGSIIIVPLIILAFLNLFFDGEAQKMGKPKTRKFRLLLLVILIAFMIVGFFIFTDMQSRNTRTRARDARIKSDLYQMRTQAELIWQDNAQRYSALSCDYNESMSAICKDIREQSGDYPVIHASQDSYCAYAKLVSLKDSWFCVDSDGNTSETTIDPGFSGYCDGKTFVCPPAGD